MSLPYAKSKAKAFTAAASSTTLTGKASQVILTATQACYVDFNLPATPTTSLYIPQNTQVTVDIYGPTFMSVIRSSNDGTLTVTELGNTVLISQTFRKFWSNANLKRAHAISITGNSLLRKRITDTYSGDATLFTRIASHYHGNAYFRKTRVGSFTGGAQLIHHS